jgi:cytochrome d ubiquinol oxidase subunit II
LLASGLSVVGVILTAGLAMFPFIMPSSSHPSSSLTAWDSVSSHWTLQLMFWVTILFLPLIGVYTSWVYYKLRGTITVATIEEEH